MQSRCKSFNERGRIYDGRWQVTVVRDAAQLLFGTEARRIARVKTDRRVVIPELKAVPENAIGQTQPGGGDSIGVSEDDPVQGGTDDISTGGQLRKIVVERLQRVDDRDAGRSSALHEVAVEVNIVRYKP